MVEECLTIFIGHYILVVNAQFVGNFPWEQIKIAPFPLPISRRMIDHKKIWMPILGNIPEDTIWEDLGQIDGYTKRATKKKIRLIFTDALWNNNLRITSNLPAKIESRMEVINLKQRLSMYENGFSDLMNEVKNHGDEDLVQKLSLKLLK